MNRAALVFGVVLAGTVEVCAEDRLKPRELFHAMDTNRDRTLQFAEIQAFRARLFDRMDANRNGFLDPAEIRQVEARTVNAGSSSAPEAAEPRAQRVRLDTNGDGAISRDEFASFIPGHLLSADVNGDQSLSLSELRVLRRK